jgi:hypothetical protein
MDALKQIVERELALDRHDDLAIQGEAFRVQIERSGDDLRKIALQVLAALGDHRDVAGIPREDATEAVPLGLVLPLRSLRNLVDRPRLHDSEWNGRFSHAALRICRRRMKRDRTGDQRELQRPLPKGTRRHVLNLQTTGTLTDPGTFSSCRMQGAE